MTNPIRPTDDAARSLAKALLNREKHASLGVIYPPTHAPMVTRIALATSPESYPMTLVSDLSAHTLALRSNPICSLLIGSPETKGDPLTHPRLTLQCTAQFTTKTGTEFTPLRAHYLAQHPKSKLYIDFADFNFVRFTITTAFLNGGFGKAFTLTANDLI